MSFILLTFIPPSDFFRFFSNIVSRPIFFFHDFVLLPFFFPFVLFLSLLPFYRHLPFAEHKTQPTENSPESSPESSPSNPPFVLRRFHGVRHGNGLLGPPSVIPNAHKKALSITVIHATDLIGPPDTWPVLFSVRRVSARQCHADGDPWELLARFPTVERFGFFSFHSRRRILWFDRFYLRIDETGITGLEKRRYRSKKIEGTC